MQVTVSIVIDTDRLRSVTDEYLADAWHVAQANPADISDVPAADLASSIGYEIIRRWLREHPGDMYHHQQNHPYWSILSKHGKWIEGVWRPMSEVESVDGVWKLKSETD